MGTDYKHIGVCSRCIRNRVGMCTNAVVKKSGKEKIVSGKKKVVAISTWIQGRLTEIQHLAKHLKKGSEVC